MVMIHTKTDERILRAVSEDLSKCATPVRSDIADAHALFLTRLGMPGAWWDAAQRIAIALETRAARKCAYCVKRKEALSPYAMHWPHASDERSVGLLSPAMIDLIHLVTTDAPRIAKHAIDRLTEGGLTEAHYVEALGVITSVQSIDQVCRALGVPLHQLPEPIPGEPSNVKPTDAVSGEAFVSMLPAQQPLPPNDDLWVEQHAYVFRALSLTPDAVRDLETLYRAHYIPPDAIMEFEVGRAISREQMELIASRVTAINECFYCTSFHVAMLNLCIENRGGEADLSGVVKGSNAVDDSILAGKILSRFVEAVLLGSENEIAALRNEVIAAVDREGFVDAACVIGNFERMVRISDGTGIPVGEMVMDMSRDLRVELGINSMPGVAHTQQKKEK